MTPETHVEWIRKLSNLVIDKSSGECLKRTLDNNSTGSLDVHDAMLSIQTSTKDLLEEIERLREYEWMYKELCK